MAWLYSSKRNVYINIDHVESAHDETWTSKDDPRDRKAVLVVKGARAHHFLDGADRDAALEVFRALVAEAPCPSPSRKGQRKAGLRPEASGVDTQ